MTVLGTDTFPIPRFITEGEGIDLRQNGVSQALVIAREGAFTVGDDTIVLLSFGASNARGNEYSVSGSDKTSDSRVTAFRPSTGTAPVATLGQEPFNTDTSIGTVNNIAFQIGKQLADRYNRNVLIILKAVANTEFTNYLTVANGGPNTSSNLFDSTAPGDDTAKLDSMVPTALALVGRAEVDFVHIDTGGVDTLEGQGVVFERVKTLTEQLRAQSWVAETTPIIYTEMPPRGSYDDVTNSLKRYCLSGIDPYVSLISTEGISFIVDEYPTVSDVAHYVGADHATMAARFITQLNELPHGNIGSTRNPLGGNGYILSTAASDGTVLGESRTVPYPAKCQIDGFVYTLSTPKATREISYIELLATDAPRNIRTTFHNYRTDGAVLCLMAPRKPAFNITDISVDGSGYVTVSYSTANGEIDDSSLDYRGRVYISGVGGATQANGRYFSTVLPVPKDGTLIIQNEPGVFTNGSAWGAYTSGGTFEELIQFEDPRTRNQEADEVYLLENESVTYERLGGGATAPFRVTSFTPHPDYGPAQDLYRPESRVLNGDFRMFETGWSTQTRSETSWVLGAANSGRFEGSRSMTLTDTSGLANQLHWAYRLRVQAGDLVAGYCFAKTTASPSISNCRLYLQYYDAAGAQVGSDVAGFADTSERTSYRALSIAGTVPATAVEAAIYLRAAMTSGTLTVTDFGLKRIDGVAYIEDFGAAGDGTTDDTMAFNVALTAGVSPHLTPGKSYLVTYGVSASANNQGIVGNGATIVMSTDAGHFDNSDYNNRFTSNAVFFKADGYDGAFCNNCKITTSAWVDDRYLQPIYFANCDRPVAVFNEIWNFSRGPGRIVYNDCTNGLIAFNYIHNSYTNSASGTSETAQVTGVLGDDACVTGSRGMQITDNTIEYLNPGPTAYAAFSSQSDGVNIAGNLSATRFTASAGNIIARNKISWVGDGVDIFCSNSQVIDNEFWYCYDNAVKMIHGASNNNVATNKATNCGRRGILVSGSMNSSVGDSDGNHVHDNTIRCVGWGGSWVSGDGSTLMWDVTANGVAQDITAIAKTTATTCTVTYSGADTYANGDRIWIDSVLGMTQINGRDYIVASVDTGANTFVITTPPNAGWPAYTSAGKIREGQHPWTGGAETACIDLFLVQNSPTWKPTNTLVENNDIDGMFTGVCGIRGGSYTGGAANNIARNNRIRNVSTYTHKDDNADIAFDGGLKTITTSSFTVDDGIDFYLIDYAGTCTATLPNAAREFGRKLFFMTQQAQAVNSATSNIVPRAGGAAGTALVPNTDGAWTEVRSNRTAWQIIRSGT